MKKKALVIGSNVSESLSPTIFEYWLKKHKINATYFFKEIKPKNFNKEIQNILNDEEVCGFNVTIPFKELIKDKIGFLDKHSNKIGAVNCVSKTKKGWLGKNTDWVGFYKSIECKIRKKNLSTALVLGYGGASKAILYSLKKMNFKSIKIYNRSLNKFLKEDRPLILNYSDLSKQIEKSDIIINTTPIDILSKIFNNNEEKKILAYDLVYKPKETGFLSHFKKEKRIYGISMLIHQAAPCFEEWFGIKPVVNKELYDILNKKIF